MPRGFAARAPVAPHNDFSNGFPVAPHNDFSNGFALLGSDTSEPGCFRTEHRSVLLTRLAIRAACVTGTLLTAICVPDVGLLVGLFGSLTAPFLVVVVPPLLALKVWPDARWGVLHVVLSALGLLGAVVGSHMAIVNILNHHA